MPEVQPIPKAKSVKGRKPPTAKTLKARATKLWGEYIHLRDRVCQLCGKATGKLDAHHVCVRQFNATRADPDNGVLLCFRCHQAMHSDPMAAVVFYSDRYGVEGYERLRRKAKDGVHGKYPASFWQGEIDRLTELLRGVR